MEEKSGKSSANSEKPSSGKSEVRCSECEEVLLLIDISETRNTNIPCPFRQNGKCLPRAQRCGKC
jgi:hypothetical protein